MGERVEVAVVGAGQAGLAISHELTRHGREHVLLEQAPRLAERWQCDRWDSFTLVTPNWALKLPGFSYQGNAPDGFLPRAAIVDYLEAYAASFAAPIQFNAKVTAVAPAASGGGFILSTDSATLAADNVVVATGLFQHPNLPSVAATLPAAIMQLHSGQYRNPEALPPGAILVVGTAQSGCQIAEELYQSGRQVFLSVGSAGRIPRRYRGRDIFWWLDHIGFFAQTYEDTPPPKSRYAGNPHLSGKGGGHTLNLHAFAREGVTLLGRVQGAVGSRLRLAADLQENLAKADGFAAYVTKVIDEFVQKRGLDAPPDDAAALDPVGFAATAPTEIDLTAANITSVIWATGYGFDFKWVRCPVFDGDGFPVQQVPGLYFLGLHWLHTRKSGLFLGVGEDATHLAEVISDRMTSKH